MEARITRVTVLPEEEEIFSLRATHIEIDDEAAGEFVCVIQNRDDEQKIALDYDEWPMVRDEIEAMFADIKAREDKQADKRKGE